MYTQCARKPILYLNIIYQYLKRDFIIFNNTSTSMTSLHFHVADYVVFGMTLFIPLCIGMYHGHGGRQSTTKEYLLAGRKMTSLPVAMSLLASFMSGITILGVPSEIYVFGIQYWLVVSSYLIVFPSVALIIVPIFYQLELSTSYEYLERRFSVGVRRIGSFLFILYTLLYMAIVTYGPSLALESVTALPVWVSILSLGFVCTVYTTIGGIRAVIWNDVFQVVIMYGGIITVMIVGTIKVGGASRVVNLLQENNRTHVSFSVDPTERTTFWVMFIGGAFAILPLWSVNQTSVQRFISVKSLREAKNSIWLSLLLSIVVVSLCSICGAVIYAYYHGCDPKAAKKISSPDQILPYFVMDVIGHLHGLPGVFLACLFSGTLSTLSSGINSIAAVFLEDVIKPFSLKRNLNFSERELTRLSKIVAGVLGVLTIALSFLAGSLGTILQLFYQVSGVTGGPVVAVYSIGLFTKFANKKGAYIGLLCGIFFGMFVAIGAKINKPPLYAPSVSIAECGNMTITSTTNSTISSTTYDGLSIYKLSPYWYSFYCYVVTLVIGILVSLIWKDTDKYVDERLFFNLKRIFPGKTSGKLEINDDQSDKSKLDNSNVDEKETCSNKDGQSSVYENSFPLVEKTNV